MATFLTLAGCATTPPPAIGQPEAPISSARPTPAATKPTATPTATGQPKPKPDTRKGAQLDQPYLVDGLIVVSKAHRVSAKYGPAKPTGPYRLDATVAAALAKMVAAAKADKVRIVVMSGYRSWTQQKASHDKALRTQPQNINFYAPPGASEHQTGQAVDLWDGKVKYRAMEDTATGKWLHKHCHEYGFILRFPENKLSITGVPYEPWHFRYVGVEHSTKFGKGNTLTLEEYLGLR